MTPETQKGERIAKIIARSGVCSRRAAERLVTEGRVCLDGHKIDTPAINVVPNQKITIDGKPLPAAEQTRLWLYHKPKGLVTSASDPEGRPTVFGALPSELPRVISVGRLDMNTEGLLLLTNDGMLARYLELPSTGWLRRYRVRAYGQVRQAQLDALKDGVAIDGILYGAIDAQIERAQRANAWLTFALREGKNREVKKIIEHLGLTVNRLIRTSYGPFQLGDVEKGQAREVRRRVLQDQLGPKIISELKLNFASHAPAQSSSHDSKRSSTSNLKTKKKSHAHHRRTI